VEDVVEGEARKWKKSAPKTPLSKKSATLLAGLDWELMRIILGSKLRRCYGKN